MLEGEPLGLRKLQPLGPRLYPGQLVPVSVSLLLQPHSWFQLCSKEHAGPVQRLCTAPLRPEFKRGAGNVTKACAPLIGRRDLKSKPARRAAPWERAPRRAASL